MLCATAQNGYYVNKPSLGSFINKLFTIALSQGVQSVVMHEAFKYLHRLSKFRGPKFIVRKFSHEVTDLHLALALLQQQNKDDREVGSGFPLSAQLSRNDPAVADVGDSLRSPSVAVVSRYHPVRLESYGRHVAKEDCGLYSGAG